MTNADTKTASGGVSAADAQAIINGVAEVAGIVLPLFLPGGQLVAGLTIPELVGVVHGVASGVPDVVAAFDAIRADGAPTPATLAALKTAMDAADDAVQRAAHG